jgi:hypothetical protein
MISQKEATDKYTKEGYLYFSFDFLEDWEKELKTSSSPQVHE